MKNLLFVLLISLLVISCNNDDVNFVNDDQEISVATIIRKNYNITTSAIISQINYEVVDNKITRAVSVNIVNSQQTTSNYLYLNNKLVKISTERNGVLISEQKYIYDSSNKIIEYKNDSFSSSGQLVNSDKHVFNRIQDTVYSVWTRSINNSNDYSPIMSSKIVLDQNMNRTYIEKYDHLNNEYKKIITTYDTNNNILNENHFRLFENGTYVNTLTNTYTYGSSINTLSFIYNNTFSKETLMLLYHLQSDAINDINVKSIVPNAIASFISTFDPSITFEISNEFNTSNYIFLSDYKTLVSNSLFSRFTYEYSFN